jgi:arylsulfatase A-like enzyme
MGLPHWRNVSSDTVVVLMNRRTFLQSAGGTMAASSAAAQQQEAPAARPNVIWIFGDQHRAQAVGCNGDPNVSTPNIDNMSALGVNFTQALSGFPLCCPARGSLLTSRYPHHCVPGHEYPLPAGQPTVAQPFREAGYHTAYFGKWHLSGWKERDGRAAMYITNPEQRGGFDTWVGYDNNNSQWDSWVHGGEGRDAFHYRLPGYETDELTNLLLKYIGERGDDARQGRGKPFFAALSVQPPHNPYVAPEEFMGRYQGRKLLIRSNVPKTSEVEETARRDLAGYYAMIENLDHNIGRIRRALDEVGLAFNTHLVFFSDHGDMHGSQGLYRKTNPYEESIRIPFVLSGEQPTYNGRRTGRVPALLNHVDVAPTTLGLCGISKPSWMEGTDLSGYRLAGRDTPGPDSAFLQLVVPTGHGDSINKPYRGVVTKDGWKYACFENMSWVMFNLNEDPYEQRNLAHNNRYRAERRKLTDRVKQWITDTGDKFPVPAD